MERNQVIANFLNVPVEKIEASQPFVDGTCFDKEEILKKFTDRDTIPCGEWCKEGNEVISYYGLRINGITKAYRGELEFGLYREPLSNTDYAGHLTLQIFDDDKVILCEDMGHENKMIGFDCVVDVEQMYRGHSDLAGLQILKDGNYYDLMDENGNCVCMTGEVCKIEAVDDDFVTLKNEMGEENAYFKLPINTFEETCMVYPQEPVKENIERDM